MEIQEQGKVSFKQAFHDYWYGYVSFQGDTTRLGYWWMFIFNVIVYGVLFANAYILISHDFKRLGGIFLIIATIYYLITLIPNIAKQTRRFQNMGISLNMSIVIVIIYKLSLIFTLYGVVLMLLVSFLPAKHPKVQHYEN